MDFGHFVLIFFLVLGIIKQFQDMKKDEEEKYKPGHYFKMKDTVGKFHYFLIVLVVVAYALTRFYDYIRKAN